MDGSSTANGDRQSKNGTAAPGDVEQVHNETETLCEIEYTKVGRSSANAVTDSINYEYNLSSTSDASLLMDNWMPRVHQGLTTWASALITHAACNKHSATVCTDGCRCQELFSKVGDVHVTCAMDPGCTVKQARSILQCMATECKKKVPKAINCFVILSDTTWPLCDPDEIGSVNDDQLCITNLESYIRLLQCHFKNVHVVCYDHHNKAARRFCRAAEFVHLGWTFLYVYSNGTHQYAEPSCWSALHMGLYWKVSYTPEEIAIAFACAFGDAAVMWKPRCRDALRSEVSKLLNLEYIVKEEACFNAASVVDAAAQQSKAADLAHFLLKKMVTEPARTAQVGASLEIVNHEMNLVGPQVLAQLRESGESDDDINGHNAKLLFIEAWNAGRDVIIHSFSDAIPLGPKRFRIVDVESKIFSRRVNRFLNEVTKDNNYIGAWFGSTGGRFEGGMGSVRFSESFQTLHNSSEEVLKANDYLLAKELCQVFPLWNRGIVLLGHEDIVVMKRPKEEECDTNYTKIEV